MAPSIERLPDHVWSTSAKKRKLSDAEAQLPFSQKAWEERKRADGLLVQGEPHASSGSHSATAQERSKAPELDHSASSHPLGVKPLGNVWGAAEVNIKDRTGLFAGLPDEVIVMVLEHLKAPALVNLGSTCKALYAFSRLDELWRTLFLESEGKQPSTWRSSWRSTLLGLPPESVSIVNCSRLYSDVLHRPWQCARLPLQVYATNIPARNAIARLGDLNAADFRSHAHRPFILTSPVKSWPIYKTWSMQHVLVHYSETVFRAEAVDWPLKTYYDYMRNNTDESPLYLFDHEFAAKMDLQLGDSTPEHSQQEPPAYTPIQTFQPDLFSVLGPHRPNHRWLILGSAGSGSTFHADPNGTSAWNAVIRGSKYWMLFPPPADGSAPSIPGVHVSDDLSEVTAPLSLAEYLLTFHEYARQTPGCIEGVCEEGEVLYVPAGWYHMVVNLEEGVAVTQNFVSESGVVDVLKFMRDRKEQVTGFKRTRDSDHEGGDGTELGLFSTKLRENFPQIYERAMRELAEVDDKKARKSKWEQATAKGVEADARTGVDDETNAAAGGFSFGFDLDDEDAETA